MVVGVAVSFVTGLSAAKCCVVGGSPPEEEVEVPSAVAALIDPVTATAANDVASSQFRRARPRGERSSECIISLP